MTRPRASSTDLRKRAEAKLGTPTPRRARRPRAVSRDPQELVHELAVHQIELEMQNEALRSARAEAEMLLRRYTELFDFAPIGYAVLDADSTIRELNLECARMLRATRGDLAGVGFIRFVDARNREAFARFLAAVLANGVADHTREACEVALHPPVGPRQRSVTVDVRLLGAAVDGDEPRALVAMHDITARKRAEDLLAEESRHKDEFLATLSHELRNPLAPIRSSLFVLDQVEPGSAAATKSLAILRRQVDHLVNIVDDLLDLTRIARGKIALAKEPVALGDMVRHAMEDLRGGFEAAGIALEDRTAAGAEETWVSADATRLNQVMGNLLSNALKFTGRGGHVTVDLHREDGQAVLSVRDDGIGIAPSVRPWLFQPFVQAPQGLDRTRGGLGLGLAMVKGLVELHGGSVEAKSEGAGAGTELVVRLPTIRAPRTMAPPAGDEAATAARRVLVIEDNRDAAEALQMLLSLGGHDVRLAYDGTTGLELARSFHPEVVFCDIGLPGMDGYQVARAMRADASLEHTCIVALSGYARPEDRDRSIAAGFDLHIAKPPSMADLKSVLDQKSRLSA